MGPSQVTLIPKDRWLQDLFNIMREAWPQDKYDDEHDEDEEASAETAPPVRPAAEAPLEAQASVETPAPGAGTLPQACAASATASMTKAPMHDKGIDREHILDEIKRMRPTLKTSTVWLLRSHFTPQTC